MWLLFRYFGFTMQEVGEAMSCTVSAVKSVLFRTRDLLRNRHRLTEGRNVIRLEVERWSNAIMSDRPQSILSDG